MVCRCSCGGEYGFEPMGFWICHRCGSVNDSGTMGGRKDGIVAPDGVDTLVWDGTDFSKRADASVRAHQDSWQAWYALGSAYGARGNVHEAGLIWTKAAAMVPDEDIGGFLARCSRQMSEFVYRGVVAGDRSNIPYARGLEDACMRRTDGRSFCADVFRRLAGKLPGLTPHQAFSVINIASAVMMQGISLHPDIREHGDILEGMAETIGIPVGGKSISPMRKAADRKINSYASDMAAVFRTAAGAVSDALEGMGGIDNLVAIQPADGTAGFADVLSRAVSKGSDIAYMRVTKASGADISSAESEMRELIGRYVSMFTEGDASVVPENRAYTG